MTGVTGVITWSIVKGFFLFIVSNRNTFKFKIIQLVMLKSFVITQTGNERLLL